MGALGPLLAFLQARRAPKGVQTPCGVLGRERPPHTHTSMGPPFGAFIVSDEDAPEFIRLYQQALAPARGAPPAMLYITERHLPLGPVLVDLDFKQTSAQRLYNADWLLGFAIAMAENIVALVDQPSFTMYVLEKGSAPRPSGKGDEFKDGIHIVVPDVVTVPAVQFALRKRFLMMQSELFIPWKLPDRPIHEAAESIYDEAVIEKNGWLMYGSRKLRINSKTEAEEHAWTNTLCYRVDVTAPEPSAPEWQTPSCSLSAVAPGSDPCALVSTLSIRHAGAEPSPLTDRGRVAVEWHKRCKEEAARLQAERQQGAAGEHGPADAVEGSASLARALMAMLSPARASSYASWINVGFAAFNTSPTLLDAWINFSTKWAKYEGPTECETEWAKLQPRNDGYRIGSLMMWAKEDNPAAYAKLMRDTRAARRPVDDEQQASRENAPSAVTYSTVYGTTWFCSEAQSLLPWRAPATRDALQHMRTASVMAGAACELIRQEAAPPARRHYGCYLTWEAAVAGLQELPPAERRLFEVLPLGRPCKPYLSIEWPTDHPIDPFVSNVELLIKRVFREDYGTALPPDCIHRIWVSDPPRMHLRLVISTHAPQLVFRSNHRDHPHGAADLARRLLELDPEGLGPMLDQTVYSKDCGMLLTESQLRAPDKVITWLDREEDVKLIDVPLRLPDVVKQPEGRVQDYADVMRGRGDAGHLSFLVCRMLELLREVDMGAECAELHVAEDAYDPGKGLAFKVDFSGFNAALGVGLVRCYVSAGFSVYAKLPEVKGQRQSLRLGPLYHEPEEWRGAAATINERFLIKVFVPPRLPGEYPDQGNGPLQSAISAWARAAERARESGQKGSWAALSIRSVMGTGKGTLTEFLLWGPCIDAVTVLVVCSRVTLSFDAGARLKDHGFVNYLDVRDRKQLSDRSKYPRVICQLESLWKLSRMRMVPDFDLIIMDESESVLRHFASPTLRSPVGTMNTLRDMVVGAKYGVVTMDASWGCATHDFLRDLKMTNNLVVNEYRGTQRTFVFSKDENAWAERILTDLRQGRNVVVASLSSAVIMRLKKLIIDQGILAEDDVLIHTSMTDDEIKQQLRDVTALWSRYRLVMYSPTVEAGVDFSKPHFHRMYLYVCAESTRPMGALQMTGRVRTLGLTDAEVVRGLPGVTIHVCAARNMNLHGPFPRAVTTTEAADYLKWVDKEVHLQKELFYERVSHELGVSHLMDVRPFVYAVRDDANSRRRFYAEFKSLAEDGGHKVVVQVDPVSEGPSAAPNPRARDDEKKARMLAARDVENEELERLMRRIKRSQATEAEKYDVMRAQFKAAYGLATLDAAFVKKYWKDQENMRTKLLHRIVNGGYLFTDSADLRIRDSNEIARARHVPQVLEALGFAHAFDTEHVVTDLMHTWAEKLIKTEFYEKYHQLKQLFSSDGISKECSGWEQEHVSQSVGMVLKSVGLKLLRSSKQHRVPGTPGKANTYTYTLDPAMVAEAANLLVLRCPACVDWGDDTPEIWRAIIRAATPRLYQHLASFSEELRHVAEDV